MILIDCHEPTAITKKLEALAPVKALKLKYGDYLLNAIRKPAYYDSKM